MSLIKTFRLTSLIIDGKSAEIVAYSDMDWRSVKHEIENSGKAFIVEVNSWLEGSFITTRRRELRCYAKHKLVVRTECGLLIEAKIEVLDVTPLFSNLSVDYRTVGPATFKKLEKQHV